MSQTLVDIDLGSRIHTLCGPADADFFILNPNSDDEPAHPAIPAVPAVPAQPQPPTPATAAPLGQTPTDVIHLPSDTKDERISLAKHLYLQSCKKKHQQ